ncbi:beta-mannanase [Neobacillus cucumis]|uniref:beta-mannanase n=1 Tax=Neobacillus cucumis TaxID=1740721 RepID=UPI002E1CF984|nr:beta-mannanase [Neobacillus cucumis]
MNWESMSSPHDEIRDVQMTSFDSVVHISWYWPGSIDFVYIYTSAVDKVKPIDQIQPAELKLYTRDEYKAAQGFIFKLEAIGQITLRIFPVKKVAGKLMVLRQENNENSVLINGLRAKIYFSITYKPKLFHARKKATISLRTEMPVDKELLVYVKKSGSMPLSIDDGTVYPFIRSFPAGKTVTPEIEIDKHEFIHIFLNKGNQTAHDYELIPE